MKKALAAIFTVVLFLSLSISTYAFSDTVKEKLKGTVILYLNDSKAYADGEAKKIDPDNIKVCPVMKQNKTLLPLRFTTESLKAQVKWDEKTNTATITLNGKTVKIKTGSTKMFINGKEKKLEVPAMDIEGRLFVPVRAVAEAFDKKIFWDDRGLIIVSNKEKPLNAEEEIVEVILGKYDSAQLFSEGFAVVSKNGKYGFIDKTGKEITGLKYDNASEFDGGTGIATRDGHDFYIDENGKESNIENPDNEQNQKVPSQNTQTNNLEKEETKMINIKTDKGDIKLEIYPDLMPITTENFISLVNKGFYDDLKFHRVEDWVVQGGDPNGNGTGGSDKTIKLETSPKLKNIRGAVAMARAKDPDSASSQFYILKKDADWLDGSYAVFGNVVSGMDIIDNIAIGDKMIKVEEVK